MSIEIKKKLSSRKFWMCAAAFLGSVATSVAGLQSGSEVVAAIGVVCGTLSAAIYAAAEAWVDTYRGTDTTAEEEE